VGVGAQTQTRATRGGGAAPRAAGGSVGAAFDEAGEHGDDADRELPSAVAVGGDELRAVREQRECGVCLEG
jgi:hypothetical protein